MLRALSLAISDLANRTVFSVLIKSVLATGAIFLILGAGMYLSLQWLLDYWLGGAAGWVESTAAIASLVLTILSGWLLFRIVAITVVWFFADDIVEAVEQRHYPLAAVRGRRPGAGAAAGLAIRSVLRVIGYNLLALPVYLLLLLTTVGAPLIFLAVNALLLGRDLEDMLAVRHGRARHHMSKFDRLALGAIGTAGLMIPIVNLVIPVIATAMAVHLMHGKDWLSKGDI